MIDSALAKRKAPALPPGDLESDQCAAALHLAPRQFGLRMVRAPRIYQPLTFGCVGQKIGDARGARGLLVDAQRQGFERLQHHPGVEGRQRRAGLAQEVVDVGLDEFFATRG